jgi:hypothetical protein
MACWVIASYIGKTVAIFANYSLEVSFSVKLSKLHRYSNQHHIQKSSLQKKGLEKERLLRSATVNNVLMSYSVK